MVELKYDNPEDYLKTTHKSNRRMVNKAIKSDLQFRILEYNIINLNGSKWTSLKTKKGWHHFEVFSFSKKTDDAIFKEFSKFGVPIVYVLEGYIQFKYKDYPLIGRHSSDMLNFYLNILKYSLNNV